MAEDEHHVVGLDEFLNKRRIQKALGDRFANEESEQEQRSLGFEETTQWFRMFEDTLKVDITRLLFTGGTIWLRLPYDVSADDSTHMVHTKAQEHFSQKRSYAYLEGIHHAMLAWIRQNFGLRVSVEDDITRYEREGESVIPTGGIALVVGKQS